MRDKMGLVGVFEVARWEDRVVLREEELGDPLGVERARTAALAKALAGNFGSFEQVAIDRFNNTVSLEYYDLVLDTMLKGDTYTANVRAGVFQNDVTPTDALTISTFRSTLGEFTSYTVDGGNSTNRASTTFAASSGQSITNSANPSRFTFTGSGTLYGAFITQGATLKDGTQDVSPAVYVAGGRFSAAQPVSSGSIIDVVYTQSKV
jgi:hypothetical protein